MINRILNAVDDYALDLDDPASARNTRDLRVASYKQWSIEEIRKLLCTYGRSDPVHALELFRNKLKRYATGDSRSKSCFAIASAITNDILEIVRAMMD